MPQKSMLIKVLHALIVKLAIVGAAVYWFWPAPKAPQVPQRVDSGLHTAAFRLRSRRWPMAITGLPDHIQGRYGGTW